MFGNAVAGDKHPEPYLATGSLTRVPAVRVPMWLYMLWLILKFACKALIWGAYNYVKFAWATVPASLVGSLFWWCGWEIGTPALITVAVALVVWWWKHPATFRRFLGWFYMAQVRRWTVYRRQWYPTCANLGLATAFGGDRFFPSIVKVRRDAEGDLITVRMLRSTPQ